MLFQNRIKIFLAILIITNNKLIFFINSQVTEENLYIEEKIEYMYDPNDMLAKPEVGSFYDRRNDNPEYISESNCNFEVMKRDQCESKLVKCKENLDFSATELKNEQYANKNLNIQLMKEKDVDAEDFYIRLIRQFINCLRLEDVKNYFSSNQSLHHEYERKISVKLTPSDIEMLEESFAAENFKQYHEFDKFFKNNVESIVSYEERWHVKLYQNLSNVVQSFSKYDNWIKILWISLAVVGAWGFVLFLIDIHRHLRWRLIIFMMAVICFIISCFIHWSTLVKQRESKIQSFFASRQFGEGRENFCTKDESWFGWAKSFVFSAEANCQEYHENILISASEHITPLMAISETFTQFLLLPVQHVGSHVGLFFKNFYEHVPLLFLIPATCILVFLLVLLILVFGNYGLYFPCWLGGILPVKSNDIDENRYKEMIFQSETRMKRNNEALIREAREELQLISNVAVENVRESASAQTYVKPIVRKCSSAIINKLEAIISEELSENFRIFNDNRCQIFCKIEGNRREMDGRNLGKIDENSREYGDRGRIYSTIEEHRREFNNFGQNLREIGENHREIDNFGQNLGKTGENRREMDNLGQNLGKIEENLRGINNSNVLDDQPLTIRKVRRALDFDYTPSEYCVRQFNSNSGKEGEKRENFRCDLKNEQLSDWNERFCDFKQDWKTDFNIGENKENFPVKFLETKKYKVDHLDGNLNEDDGKDYPSKLQNLSPRTPPHGFIFEGKVAHNSLSDFGNKEAQKCQDFENRIVTGHDLFERENRVASKNLTNFLNKEAKKIDSSTDISKNIENSTDNPQNIKNSTDEIDPKIAQKHENDPKIAPKHENDPEIAQKHESDPNPNKTSEMSVRCSPECSTDNCENKKRRSNDFLTKIKRVLNDEE